jgi:1-deoxy-D-xylulose-5-phosphate synthase
MAGRGVELTRMVATAGSATAGPIAFRFPRGEGVGVEILDDAAKRRMIREGS